MALHHHVITIDDDSPVVRESTPFIEAASMGTVKTQLPKFSEDDPEVFFLQCEMVFELNRIKNSLNRFRLVASQLDGEAVKEVLDLIRRPPEQNPYEILKDRIMRSFGDSDCTRIRKLLEDQRLGDLRPSHFLRDLRQLGGTLVTEEILRTVWMRGLPIRMQAALAATEHTDLTKLSMVADRVAEAYEPQIAEAAAVSKVREDKLLAAIESLTERVAALEAQTRAGKKPGAVPRSRSTTNQQLCFYHERFGEKATRCRPPCSWKSTTDLKPVRNRPKAGGKLLTATEEAETVAEVTNRRLFISDRKSGIRYLVDTGATLSVFPVKLPTKKKNDDLNLYAANGTPIPTYGTVVLNLDLGLRRKLTWRFILAKVSHPIIGADLLYHHSILVDLAGCRLVDSITGLTLRGQLANVRVPSISSVPSGEWFTDILRKYPGVTQITSFQKSPKHDVVHYIETKGAPVTAKARRLPTERYNAAKKEFMQMVEEGICRPSNSPWASPLHIVQKKDGGIRPCGDYRQLNARTVPDRYAVPNLADFNTNMHGNKIFTKLDLNRAYYQIPMATEDIPKTAVITPFGLFEFLRMCFGLRNASQTFQRFLDHVLRGLEFAWWYLDDILIGSRNEKEHIAHLQEVLQRLEDRGLTINLAKCVFAQPEVEFLGHKVNSEGITALPTKVEAIASYPRPTTVKELRRFLGMFNFYRRCIPRAAELQAALNRHLAGSKKNDSSHIPWTEESVQAFERCKAAIKEAAVIGHPKPDAELVLVCDASSTAMGAVLQQREGTSWRPLGFFSKSLTPAQQKYATYDRELLAIHRAIKHFRCYLEGRHFVIWTDHKPLQHAFSQKPETATPMRIRLVNFISQFTTDIRHVAGEDNAVADALSRVEDIECTEDFSRLAKEQATDPNVPELGKNPRLKLRWIKPLGSPVLVLCETSTPHTRPYVPESMRQEFFERLHGLSHPGIRATRRLLTQRFFWPSMNADVARWARCCIPCQRSKVIRHTVSSPAKFAPSGRFEHVHVDIIGPLPPSNGKRYCLTIIDRFTRWPEACPLENITSATAAEAIVSTWVARYGTPARITTDQGRQFESELFSNLTRVLGIQRCRTTAYHPQSNGCVERWHRSLKASLMATLNNEAWTTMLPTVLLGLRSAVRQDNGASAAEMTFGEPLRLPGEFFEPSRRPEDTESTLRSLRRAMKDLRPAPHRNSKVKTFVHGDLKTCGHVFLRDDSVRKPLTPPYSGPYRVITREEKTFTVQLPSGPKTVSIDRLKAAHLLEETTETTSRPTPAPNDLGKEHPPSQSGYSTRFGRKIKPTERFCVEVIGGE